MEANKTRDLYEDTNLHSRGRFPSKRSSWVNALICIKMKRLIISGSNDRPCNPSEYKSL